KQRFGRGKKAKDEGAKSDGPNYGRAEKKQQEQARGLSLNLGDFLAYMPQHNYIFTPSREPWPAASVSVRVPPVPSPDGKPIKPSEWLDANAAVEQMTWAPGEPMLIKNRLVSDGGWIERPGCNIFNLYLPPHLVPIRGDVTPWLSLMEKVFPEHAEH